MWCKLNFNSGLQWILKMKHQKCSISNHKGEIFAWLLKTLLTSSNSSGPTGVVTFFIWIIHPICFHNLFLIWAILTKQVHAWIIYELSCWLGIILIIVDNPSMTVSKLYVNLLVETKLSQFRKVKTYACVFGGGGGVVKKCYFIKTKKSKKGFLFKCWLGRGGFSYWEF